MKKKKNNNYLTIFIKSFLIGMGIIFPISGSYLAFVLGMYDWILDIINNFKKKIKENWREIIIFVIGIILSCAFSVVAIHYTYDKYPVATLLSFLGVIVGGIPIIWKETKKEYKTSNFLFLLIGALILVGISFISGGKADLSINGMGSLFLFSAGAIGAGAMIIPGVSGSVVLVVLGCYDGIIRVVYEILKFKSLAINIPIILIFGAGAILGIIITSKVMEHMMKKHSVKTHFAITGFVIASVINVLLEIYGLSASKIELFIGILLFIGGFFLAYKVIREK
ncbi:MAG: DUF368 domain-containing protein [Mollicutes bacterium]|nr:DUF368 domain-containing protein [Mollicutes bacterium]